MSHQLSRRAIEELILLALTADALTPRGCPERDGHLVSAAYRQATTIRTPYLKVVIVATRWCEASSSRPLLGGSRVHAATFGSFS